jgi:hypothetical protein
LLRSKGRGKDTILAHINPREAALLKRHGGSGDINPDTGLPQFDDGENASAPVTDYSEPASVAQAPEQPAFDPFSYGTAPGEEVYRGDASQPTPLYASSIPQPAATFGGTGGAVVNPNLPGAATALEPTPTPSVDTGDKDINKVDQGKSLTDQFKMPSLGQLGTLGLAGALGAYGASQARRGAAQTQAATAQQQQIAAPYQQQGQQLVAQAQAGQLTPSSQQALEAAKAQLAQSQSNRGGVGAQQSANQIANIYQTLLDNQYKYGLQVMQIGDNISIGAIKSGLQLDQQLQTSTNNFYSQLASIVGGQPIRVGF